MILNEVIHYFLYLLLSGRELTDSMILSLSQHITDETEVRNLATNGLGMEEHIVDKHVNTRKPDMTLAAQDIIKVWRNKIGNSKIAYTRLCDALNKAGMPYYIVNALERLP